MEGNGSAHIWFKSGHLWFVKSSILQVKNHKLQTLSLFESGIGVQYFTMDLIKTCFYQQRSSRFYEKSCQLIP